MKNLSEMSVIGRVQVYPFHPQANATVERWNKTLIEDIVYLMSTWKSDWDGHGALSCPRYYTTLFFATGMTNFKAIFDMDAFKAWEELDSVSFDEEPTNLSNLLDFLHRQLRKKVHLSGPWAKKEYYKKFNPLKFKKGDRILLCSIELSN